MTFRPERGVKITSIHTHSVRIPFDMGAKFDDMGGITFR